MRKVIALGIVLIVAVLMSPAFAASATFADPDEDDTVVPDDLDLIALAHADTTTQITYTATVAGDPYSAATDTTPVGIAWFMDWDLNGTTDACVAASVANSASLVGAFFDGACPGGPFTAGTVVSSVTVTVTRPTTTSFQVVFPISALNGIPEAAGLSDYDYVVGSRQTNAATNVNFDDVAPDGGQDFVPAYVHELDAPIPAAATPTPSPTPAATVAPTAAPVVTPVPTATTAPILPRTGPAVGGYVRAAITLLILGGSLIYYSRQRLLALIRARYRSLPIFLFGRERQPPRSPFD